MSPVTTPCMRAWRCLCCLLSFCPWFCGVYGGGNMTIFGDVDANSGRKGKMPIPSDWTRLMRPAAIGIAVFVAIFIFFNYIAAVMRIGAGYVGVEILLSGS